MNATEPLTDTDPARWRLTVRRDDDADDPGGWGNIVLVPLDRYPGRNGGAEAAGDDYLGLAGALARFREGITEHHRGRAYPDSPTEAAIRWARTCHGTEVVYNDRADALVYLSAEHRRYYAESSPTRDGWLTEYHGGTDAAAVTRGMRAHLEGEVETWRRWADGEVYCVTLEHAVTWHRTELHDGDPDETMTTWEPVDSLSGCYLVTYGPDTYTAADVARENFDVPAGLDLAAVAVIEP